MRIAVFSAKPYDRRFLDRANAAFGHELTYLDARLDARGAGLAAGCAAACAFVADRLDAEALERLAAGGTRLALLRCAGVDNVDLAAAARLGVEVANVPAYSPHAVAEYTVGLLLALERNIARAAARVRGGDFSLDGLVGRNLHRRRVGVVGTGRIGGVVARILLHGFGCDVLACDPTPDAGLAAAGVVYADRGTVLAEADIVTLHCPLLPATRHLLDAAAIARLRPGARLVNTGRGALVDTAALIDALESGRVGGAALDVYEHEAGLFFADRSADGVRDETFRRLLACPNVLVTGHQGFLAEEALAQIARATLASAAQAEAGRPLALRVGAGAAAPSAGKPAATVRSWHAHVYYDPATTRGAAERVRAGIDRRFAAQLGRWHDAPVGPHTAAMYQVAFDAAQFAVVVPWLALNREGLSVLVHPNTLAPRDDHLKHALWLGAPLPLKGDALPEASAPGDEPPPAPNTAASRGE